MSAPLKQKEVLQPSRLRARRRKLRTIKLVSSFLFLVLFVASCVGAFYIPALRVRDVAILDTKSIDAEAVERVVRDSLSGRKWFVLPRNNAFLFSEEEMRETVHGAFPKIKKINITLSNFHSIEVAVEERIAYALWCGKNKAEEVPCVYLDRSGVLYEQSAEYSGNAYVKWYGEVVGEGLGGVYLGEVSASLFPLVAELGDTDMHPQEVVVEKNGDVKVLFEGGFELLFTTKQKPEVLLSALKIAKTSDALKDKKLSDLLYLDMRFSESRLYYKFK